MKMKTCRRCRRSLEVSKFGKYSKSSDGLNDWCRKCKRQYQQERRAEVRQSGKMSSSTLTRWKLRVQVLQAYGGPEPRCECCGENTYEFLSIDHINGEGNRHRQEIGRGSLYPWLKRQGYPSGFRVLCHNCNQAIGHYGYCPHHAESLGFDVPLSRYERNRLKVLSAARKLVKQGIYPSYPKLIKATKITSSMICRVRKEAIADGKWPAQKEALKMDKKYRPRYLSNPEENT